MSDDERAGDPLGRLRQIQLDLPEHGTGARAARRPVAEPAEPVPGGPTLRWMAGFAGLLVVALIAGVALTYLGLQTVRDSTAGRTVATSDPSEPGFEAFLEPTPTLLVLHESGGSLLSMTLLGLGSQDTGGSVLVIPPSTRVESEHFSGPLSVAYAFGGGVDAMFHHVEALLGVGIAEHVVVEDDRWARLTEPVAPLSLDNPDGLDGFEAGPIELEAEEVSTWLSARVEGESELSHLLRVELFWEAWLERVEAANDPAAVPGEIESGIGRFVRGLSAGPRQVATLPVVEETDASGATTVRVDPAPADALVAQMIPFPRGHVEAARTRVRLLDGTGTTDHALKAAPLIVPAGAEIVIVGNAESFERPRETEIRYHADSQEEAAERMREALGVGQVVDDPRQVDSFDVTIILGTDI